MSRFVFYCHDDPTRLADTEYYQQDIEALKALGHEVVVCTRYRDIPRQFDAMFVWWWTYALWPALLCRLRGKPCIITGVFNFRFPASFEGQDYFRRPWWQRRLISGATRLASLNLFIDEVELQACTAHFRLATGRYYPCAVHEDYLQGPLPERSEDLFNLAWGGRQNVVRKGIPELLRAVRLLKDEGVPVRLDLAGHPGDGTPMVLDLIRDLDLGDRVRWLGPLSRADKIQKLRACEVYVQPSHYEGFGLATAEAMGCGSCVITCDVGAVRSVVGDAGTYVRPGEARELADAIRYALANPEWRRQMQQAAQHRVAARFAPARKRDRLQQCLDELDL